MEFYSVTDNMIIQKDGKRYIMIVNEPYSDIAMGLIH